MTCYLDYKVSFDVMTVKVLGLYNNTFTIGDGPCYNSDTVVEIMAYFNNKAVRTRHQLTGLFHGFVTYSNTPKFTTDLRNFLLQAMLKSPSLLWDCTAIVQHDY